MKIIFLFLFALMVVAYYGNTRPQDSHAAETAAAAWIVANPNYDPAVGR